jgi:hypothetical protein
MAWALRKLDMEGSSSTSSRTFSCETKGEKAEYLLAQGLKVRFWQSRVLTRIECWADPGLLQPSPGMKTGSLGIRWDPNSVSTPPPL